MADKRDYIFDLKDYNDLHRIQQFFKKQLEIMEILDADSRESIEGGASVYYKVKIILEEKWI